MTDFRGGCACGAVRYEFAAYEDAGYCHCSRCRRAHGAVLSGWARVSSREFVVTTGEPRAYEGRRFCAACGSSLFHGDQGSVFVNLGSLDDPERIAPRVHRCVADQLSWLKLGDLLPFVDGAELTPPAARTYLRKPVDPTVTPQSPISLREINADNLRAIVLADVAGAQRRFVASNAISLAQAHVAGDAWYRAIYAGETVVGFVMAARLHEDEYGLPTSGDPNLWRFMIDEGYQKNGFGRRALELIVTELRTWGGKHIWLGCMPGAGSPYEFYRRFGFVDTGVHDEDGELFMYLPLAPTV